MTTAGVLRNCGLVVLGVATGYVLFDRPAEVQKLRPQAAGSEVVAISGPESGPRLDIGSPAAAPPDPRHNPAWIITEQDLRIAQEMNERRTRGEYILDFERPTDRKFRFSCIDDLVERMSSNNAPKVDLILRHLGVGDDVRGHLEAHQKKIQKASLEFEMALEQLLEARLEYDNRARAAMNSTQYARYRAYEDSLPALREYDKIERSSITNGVEMNPDDKEKTIALIQELQAYTDRYSHGPYDSLAEVAIGTEAVLEALTNQIDHLTGVAAQLREAASACGISDAQAKALTNYYSAQIARKESAIQWFLSGAKRERPRHRNNAGSPTFATGRDAPTAP